MTAPWEPREPRDPRAPRGPYEPDDPTWGGPSSGGWESEPGYGRHQRGGPDPGDYDPAAYDPARHDPGYDTRGYDPGPYGSEPEYGWRQPEYEPAGSYGAAPPPGVDAYRPEPGRREPAWAPGAPGSPSASRRSTRRHRRRPPWIPVAIAAAVVVLVLVLGFVAPGWFLTRVFDAGAVQTGVAKILTDDYGAEGVADVRCPENVGVVAGAAFTCDATIDGDPVKVPVRVTDGNGRYEVGRPA